MPWWVLLRVDTNNKDRARTGDDSIALPSEITVGFLK